MKIRTAVVADESALAGIDAATWDASVTPSATRSPARAFFDARTPPDWVLVAEADHGEVVGFLTLRRPTALASNAHVLEIQGLAVAPEHQGRGIGRALLTAAATRAVQEGASRLRLRVLATNPRAVALYLSCGYRVEGVLQGEFVLDGRLVDDIFMALDLDDTARAGGV